MDRSEVTPAVLVLVFIQGFLSSAAVEVQPSSNPAVAGETVTLSLSPSQTMKGGNWAVGGSLILTWVGNQQAVFPNHTGRASVNVLSGALTLRSVTAADSGVYTVQSSDPQLTASISITVMEPVFNVTLRVNQADLMEFNSSAVVSCSASSGSLPSFLWMNGSTEITRSDRVQLTDGNTTLTINNVTRYDQGPIRCRVFNAVSSSTSDAMNLTIIYGPDNMALTVNGHKNPPTCLVGSNLTMLCLTQSSPPAHLQWMFRGELVNVTVPVWDLSHVSEEQSGPYSCLAFNNRTNLHNSITAYITIAESPLSGHERQAVNLWLLPLLLLVGLFFSWTDIGGSLSLWRQ